MTRAPLVMAKPEQGFARGKRTVWDTTLGWRFPNPRMEEMFPLESMGETGENVAERWDVSRRGTGRVRAALAAALGCGGLLDELVAVNGVEQRRASGPTRRRRSSARCGRCSARAARSPPETRADQRRRGGARHRLRGEGARARRRAARRLRRLRGGRGRSRVMGIGPIPAVRKLLERAGSPWTTSTWWSRRPPQSLVVIRELGLDPRRSTSTAARSRSAIRSG